MLTFLIHVCPRLSVAISLRVHPRLFSFVFASSAPLREVPLWLRPEVALRSWIAPAMPRNQPSHTFHGRAAHFYRWSVEIAG